MLFGSTRRWVGAAMLLIGALGACAGSEGSSPSAESSVSTAEGAVPSDQPIRLPYGDAPQQFGDLWLSGDDGAPVVVLIHGGFWRNPYALDLMEPLADDLVDRGYAVWNVEYRRLGDDGGGWPGTFEDVADAVDAVGEIAREHPVDPDRVAVVGHSAGGHLALWSAGRADLPDDAPGAGPAVVPVIAIGQGAVVDLTSAASAGLGNGATIELLDGTPSDHPERYVLATPSLTDGTRNVSVVGTADDIVPPSYSVDPRRPGAVDVVSIDGANHFDLIDPTHPAWLAVIDHLDATFGTPPR